MSIREYLDEAISAGKTVTIKYVKYGGEFSVRQISDIHYSDEFGSDYIKAFCHKRRENRTFKISRIISVDGITDVAVSTSSIVKMPKTAYAGNYASSGPTVSNKPSSNRSSPPKPIPSYNNTSPKPLYSSSSKISQSSSSRPQKSEGCYIATMAYGSYDHPQVLVLRKYRDDVLLESRGGRLFVKLYYWLSPKAVSIFRGHDGINMLIRNCLDAFIERIRTQ